MDNEKSYPIDVRALAINWIIEDKDDEGIKFLRAIRDCGNNSLYE